MNDLGKKRKATTTAAAATTAATTTTTFTAHLLSIGGRNEDATGIAKKLANFEKEIERINVELDVKNEEITKLKSEINCIKTQIKQVGDVVAEKDAGKKLELQNQMLEFNNQKDELQYRALEFNNQKDELNNQKDELNAERKKLTEQFVKGDYYAPTQEYLGMQDNDAYKVDWSEFIRDAPTPERMGPFSCWYCKKGGTADHIVVNDPYYKTRIEVEKSNTVAPDSNTSRNSSLPQSDKEAGLSVWPTDIFGNSPQHKSIAHLLPAGYYKAHKHWLNIACAVLGIKTDDLNVKKKAMRGIITPGKITPDGNTQKDALVEMDMVMQEPRKMSREPLTGVVHFVSNKIRLANQQNIFDGSEPSCLIIPVMNLEQAKQWRGEPYKAICLMGIPKLGFVSGISSTELYKSASLNDTDFMRTRDALEGEVTQAIDFLKQAVLALRDMIAHLSDEEIEYADGKKKKGQLTEARQEASGNKPIKVPFCVKHSECKPVCLITFDDSKEFKTHPPPDPLLLVLKSANNFGIMAKMKMLANAINNDITFCEGDLIEMEKYLEAQEKACRAVNWNDLASRLGQPNGYFSTTSNPNN